MGGQIVECPEPGADSIRQDGSELACKGHLQADPNTHATGRAAGTNHMIYIAVIAVIGIVLLQLTGSIPRDSVGGAMVIAMAVFAGALAVGIHDAWTKRRGLLGWIVNIVASFVGALVAAPLGGMVMVMILLPFMGGTSSLAAAGGPQMLVALTGQMVLTLLGSWGAIWLVNRWR